MIRRTRRWMLFCALVANRAPSTRKATLGLWWRAKRIERWVRRRRETE